jgi:flavin reductase (DIM6/NTAB) family NADH-FMN oxidoreductase RutF
MPIPGDLYKKLGRSAAGPVCVVAAFNQSGETIVGLTASSFVTLSFEPPMVMFALQQNADSYAAIVESKAFGVSLLRHTQSQVATAFARKGRAKIEGTTFTRGQILDCPLIPDALAHIECLTNEILLSGDHAIVVGLVEAAVTYDGQPLLYFGGRYGTFAELSS